MQPYMEDKKDEENLASTGVKWKDMVKNRRKEKGGQTVTPPAETTVAQTEPQPAAMPEPTTPIQPEPAVAVATTPMSDCRCGWA